MALRWLLPSHLIPILNPVPASDLTEAWERFKTLPSVRIWSNTFETTTALLHKNARFLFVGMAQTGGIECAEKRRSNPGAMLCPAYHADQGSLGALASERP
jgi:hypothetical protein